MGNSMYEVILDYFDRRNKYHNEQNIVTPKNKVFDRSAFKEHFGFDLPQEIAEYLGLLSHDYVYGWVRKMCKYSDESIILYNTTKDDNENLKELIRHTDMIHEDYPETQDMVYIGWTGYSGSYIMYDSKTRKIYFEGLLSCAIADSLTELISEMEFNMRMNDTDITENQTFMRSFFKRYYQKLYDTDAAEGCAAWELIPANISNYEMMCLQGFEYTDFIMPDCIKAYLSVYHHYFDMPVGINPPDDHFSGFLGVFDITLANAGYYPFAADGDNRYIRCIDLDNFPYEKKCQVCEIDRGVFSEIKSKAEDACVTVKREELSRHIKYIADSFYDYLDKILDGTIG